MGIRDKNKSRNFSGISLGINIAVGMAFFTISGDWIDKKLGENHVWILVGMALGLLYCGYEIWKIIRISQEESTDNNQTKSS